jgi:hypothetical protein
LGTHGGFLKLVPLAVGRVDGDTEVADTDAWMTSPGHAAASAHRSNSF